MTELFESARARLIALQDIIFAILFSMLLVMSCV